MCGRYTLRTPQSRLAEQFEAQTTLPFVARYNIAPTQSVLAVRQAGDGREVVALRWGLVPSWAHDPSVGSQMINARSETAHEKRAFREAYRERRCLIPADGFYEWRAGGGRKQPYFIHLPGEPLFAFAGLWETWQAGAEVIETCTILTTSAVEQLRMLHERMPVIVAFEDYAHWLDPNLREPAKLEPLFRSDLSRTLELELANPRVNRVANDDEACLRATEQQGTLF